MANQIRLAAMPGAVGRVGAAWSDGSPSENVVFLPAPANSEGAKEFLFLRKMVLFGMDLQFR
jgi:hypothetical protein